MRTTDFPINREGEETDQLMTDVATQFARQAAQRTVDVLMPIKVLDREENTVTINRGDRSGLSVGEVLAVFGPGKVILDEETGKQIKRKGPLIGKVLIQTMDSGYCQGQVLEEKEPGKSIAKGCVLSRQRAGEVAQ